MAKTNGPTTESGDGQVYIEYWPLSRLTPAERNPKLHEIEEIAQSLRRFGVANIVAAVDERTGRMYVGHGRREALELYKERLEAGEEGWETPPRRLVVQDGEWRAPVLRGVSFKDDAEAEAYLLADNRLTEKAGWSDVALMESLRSLQSSGLAGTGFSQLDLDNLEMVTGYDLSKVEFKEYGTDAADALKEKPLWVKCPKCGHRFKL